MENIYIFGVVLSFILNFLLLFIYKDNIQKFLGITFQYTKIEFAGILLSIILVSLVWFFEIVLVILWIIKSRK